MDPTQLFAALFASSVAAGVLGSLLGLGGGIIVIPILTLLLGVDIRYAVGASIVSVIATSNGATASHLRDGIANLRVGMLLETATATGAMIGALATAMIGGRPLYLIFAVVLGVSSVAMFWRRNADDCPNPVSHPWAERLRLGSSFPDRSTGRTIRYGVAGVPVAMGLMLMAGVVSGLLGVGSGTLKVPAMDLAMRLPVKVSTATSNFMIGVTAAAGAAVHFTRGDVQPLLAAPVALGVLVGAVVGARTLGRLHSSSVRTLFVLVLVVVSVQMAARGLGFQI
ncbi:MAG TPA: sulfite exporter TauE/SafE family protein [Chloroflexota bacterium]|nr:sulfite exporter TauE/SafE family protein [Chloroflexota bacterium]